MSGKFVLLDCPIFNCIILSGSKSEAVTQTLVTILFSREQIRRSLDSVKLYDCIKRIHDKEEYLLRTRLEYNIKSTDSGYRVIFEVSNDRINVEPYLVKLKSFLINELIGIDGFETEVINGFRLTFMI